MAIDTHHIRIAFGRHAGELWTRVPVGYLRWMVNHPSPQFPPGALDLARAELDRRGTPLPTMEISGHAIDRASLRLLGLWRDTRRDSHEGLYSWLMRLAEEAYTGSEEGLSMGVRFVFEPGEAYPTVKTVMPAK